MLNSIALVASCVGMKYIPYDPYHSYSYTNRNPHICRHPASRPFPCSFTSSMSPTPASSLQEYSDHLSMRFCVIIYMHHIAAWYCCCWVCVLFVCPNFAVWRKWIWERETRTQNSREYAIFIYWSWLNLRWAAGWRRGLWATSASNRGRPLPTSNVASARTSLPSKGTKCRDFSTAATLFVISVFPDCPSQVKAQARDW